jgi:hypothetical protein
MPGAKVRKIDGLKQIKVSCLSGCGVEVSVNVALDFEGTMRKFCHHCNKRAVPTAFEGSLTDGCRHVSKR